MKLVNENISTLRNQFSLTVNYIKDKKGYVVYFSEFPDISDQGKTKNEALKNLIKTVNIVLKYKKESDNFKNSSSEKIIFQEM